MYDCNPEVEIPKYRLDYEKKIDSISKNLNEYTIQLGTIDSAFSDTLASNKRIYQKNDSVKNSIDSLLKHNRAIKDKYMPDTCFSTEECDSIFQKLSSIHIFSDTEASKIYESFSTDSLEVIKQITEARERCGKTEILTQSYIDSIMKLYTNQSLQWRALIDSIKNNNEETDKYNNWVFAFMTDTVDVENDSVDPFNSTLSYFCTTRQNDPDTVLQKIDSLEPGDYLLLDTGTITFSNDITFFEKGDDANPIYIIGDPDDRTTIHAPYFGIDSSSNIIFKNLIFSKTGKDEEIDKRNGVRIVHSNTITFINCTFENNDLRGIYCESSGKDGDITIKDCIIRHNSNNDSANIENRGGIRFFDCGQINLDNVLVVNNTGHGINVDQTPIIVRRATICDNTLNGIHHLGANGQGELRCYTSIIAYNGENGIYQNPIEGVHTAWIDNSNRFFNNPEEHFIGSAVDIAENTIIETDPEFVNKENGDYHSKLNDQGIGYQYK